MDQWPKSGQIKFRDVSLRYRPNTDLALQKVSFDVKGGEKIGIVGRTGAGKSTLCLAITRILEVESGVIEIDGVDISSLDLNLLRGKVTMIPQDPCLFTGSLRFNLDPFDRHPDERLL